MTEFLNRELAVARVKRAVRLARMTVLVADNSYGVSLLPYAVRVLHDDERVVDIRLADPHQPGSASAGRWRKLHGGMSIAQYGKRIDDIVWARRDVDLWQRKGWVVVRDYLRDDTASS